ncbi:MAG: sulfate ABC transporter substrate-binding protein [Lautropia sp.]|nr:sulfate ABC transporter substrate-binding protein [Lautropia sp.]
MATRRSNLTLLGAAALSAFAPVRGRSAAAPRPVQILNVSYEPTREMYAEFNQVFARYWQDRTGQALTVLQSHGGSGKQARSIMEGLDADVATLALATDTDALYRNGGWIPEDWQKRLPDDSTPYTSTIVLVVRRGNPRDIRDWDDLVRPDVKVMTPNPKTSGGARWNYLAAWGYARRHYGSDEAAMDYMRQLFARVPVLSAGARGASIAFVRRNLGDVFLSWENEAWLLHRELPGQIDIVYPSMSILAEPAVTVVDRNVDRKGTRAVAEAYLRYLYTDTGQALIARHGYRPRSKAQLARVADRLPPLDLFTVDQAFGGWKQANDRHFMEGGTFDRIFLKKSS